jgi:hypothetical protein
LRQLTAREAAPATLCFNGDFNWFNVDDASFAAINQAVLAHDACLGNVEAELLSPDDGAGCGCAYPADVDAGTVERSNRIHARLKQTAQAHPELRRRLGQLPMLRRYRVGSTSIGVVHGDAESLAGWGFDIAALDAADKRDWIAGRVSGSRGRGLRQFPHLPARPADDGSAGVVINNGAAGMPNFAGRLCGVVTRIAVSPAPTPVLYGCRLGSLHIDALPLDYDSVAWEAAFLANWPPGSPAHVSYYRRIVDGPDHVLTRAAAPTR